MSAAAILAGTWLHDPRTALIAALPLALAVWANLRRACAPQPRYRRGAEIVARRRWLIGGTVRGSEAAGVATLAGRRIPGRDEVKHFKIVGATGSGKTTAICELLDCALARGDRALIADPDGGYAARFHRPRRGDVLLNPFDPRSLKWDWYAEIERPYDVDLLVNALIPGSADAAGEEWRGYARTFCIAVARYCVSMGREESMRLWHWLTVAKPEELRRIVAGSAAQSFLEPENSRMFGSIRSVCASAVAPFEYVARQRARLFAVRPWVRRLRESGVLFLPYHAAQIPALRQIIAAWLRLAIIEALSGAEGVDQRLWILVDELDALGPIEGLKDAMARLRKFGGRCVLGFQSIAQVSGNYGAGVAQTIVENCANTLILRCSGSENGGTSQFASRLIGEREVMRAQIGRSRDQGGFTASRGARRSTSWSRQSTVEVAVLPSEIERLADLYGYLKIASDPAWHRVSLRTMKRRA